MTRKDEIIPQTTHKIAEARPSLICSKKLEESGVEGRLDGIKNIGTIRDI
jgi:hypothetical protein